VAHTRLDAHSRTEFGNGPSRRLRRQGLVPGVVYQRGSGSLHVALPDRELRRALSDGGRTSVIDLSIAGAAPRPVLFKEWQLDPVRGEVVHIDFQQVDLTQEIEASVAIVLTGDPIGVREGGILDQTLREVTVSALPDALPDAVEIDVSGLDVGDSITVGDLTAPSGSVITSDPELGVASVVAPALASVEGDEADAAEPGAADEGGDDSGE
jgi:large subunit ribosomal protein L25